MKAIRKYIFGINILTAISFLFIIMSGYRGDWPMFGYLFMSVIYYKSNVFVFEGMPTIISAIYNYILVISVIAICFSGFRHKWRWHVTLIASIYLFSFFLTPVFSSDFIGIVTIVTTGIFILLNTLSAIGIFSLAKEERLEI